MSVQRVVVVRTGGFAGVRREAEIDDPERAAAFAHALRADGPATSPPHPDGFTYSVTVISTSGHRTHDVDEGAMSTELRSLVRRLFV